MRRLLQLNKVLRRSQVANFSSVSQGSKFSPTFKQFLTLSDGNIGSYWHDVPLDLDHQTVTVNMVVEIPRWSQAKFEINKETPWNAIMQDCNGKGEPRFVKNLFPFHGYIHNYGALPRTWEDPMHVYPGTQYKGDNDPLDCCEIGSQVLPIGSIRRVKLLGSLGLIDDGELDWKCIVIDCQDPLAPQVNNLDDVEKHFPQLLYQTRQWFRNYKIPDGKPANKFAFNEEYMGVNETINIVKQCHNAWNRLIEDSSPGDDAFTLPNTTSRYKNDNNYPILPEPNNNPDSKIPDAISKWYYVSM